jgi:ABC-type oligopeptide transport system substrate-binding subunit
MIRQRFPNSSAPTARAKRRPSKSLYAQAEQIAVFDDPVMIPLYWYTNVQVTRPWIKRTYASGGHQRYEHWEVVQ